MRKLAILCSVVSIASIQAQQPVPPAAAGAAVPVVDATIPSPTAVPVAVEPPVPVTVPVPPTADAAALGATAPVVSPNARTVHEFQGDDVSMVLRLLARQAGINIMVSDQIVGTINMRVENLTPLEAIKVIVDAKATRASRRLAREGQPEAPVKKGCLMGWLANIQKMAEDVRKK